MKICRARSLPDKCQLSAPGHRSLFHCFKQAGEPPCCSRSGPGLATLVNHSESPVTCTGQSSSSGGVREVRHLLAQSLNGHTRIETTVLPLMKRILHHHPNWRCSAILAGHAIHLVPVVEEGYPSTSYPQTRGHVGIIAHRGSILRTSTLKHGVALQALLPWHELGAKQERLGQRSKRANYM